MLTRDHDRTNHPLPDAFRRDSLIHSHKCRTCGELCSCVQEPCEARWNAKREDAWECFRCHDERILREIA